LVTESRAVPDPWELGVDEFDARFALMRDRLVRICTGFVGASMAEDVVHDAFIRGRARRHQLRDDDLFEAWITRVAIRLCLDRKAAGRRLLDVLLRMGKPARDVGRDVGLRDLVAGLPPRERTLVVLHYGHGYRLEEIAEMTGLSAVNVRTIIFRARRRLREQVERANR
jgi:RNA polymerase sigma-70 factor (ECF subfamily)